MITNKETPTPYPHYSISRFAQPQTVYLSPNHKLKNSEVKGAEYNYSDRLIQWYGYDKSEQADKAATVSGFNRWSAAWAEVWLQTLLDNPSLELVHMMAGFNLSNEYGYWIYGYITSKADA